MREIKTYSYEFVEGIPALGIDGNFEMVECFNGEGEYVRKADILHLLVDEENICKFRCNNCEHKLCRWIE